MAMYEIDGTGRSASEVFVDMRALEEGEVAYINTHTPPAEDAAAPENTDVWAAPVLSRLGDPAFVTETSLQVGDVDVTELVNDELPTEHTSASEEPAREPLQGPPSSLSELFVGRSLRERFRSSSDDEAFNDGEEQRSTLGPGGSSAGHWLGADPQTEAPPALPDWVTIPPPPDAGDSEEVDIQFHRGNASSISPDDASSSSAPLRPAAITPSSSSQLQPLTSLAASLFLARALNSNPAAALPQAAVSSSLASTGMEEESPTCNSGADSNFAAVAADSDIGLQFSCPICLEVCEEAVETPCCHNLFCQRCLLSEEHRISVCPICKSHLEVQEVRPNVPVRRIVADLPCHCRFEGCGIKLRRRDRVRHEALCDFMLVQCRYSAECPLLLRSQVAHHEAEVCLHRPVICPMNCGASIPFLQLDDHLGRECPCWLCKCEYCETPICRADLDEHIQVHCQLAIVVCGLPEADTEARCEHRCERCLLEKHREDCVFKPCTCRHEGCSHITTARLLPVHEESCQWRLIQCQHCGADLCMGSLQQHLQDVCPEYEMPCPFSVHGCTEKVPRRLMEIHLQQATSQHLSFVCDTLRLRELEIDSLRGEVVRMRNDFNHRISNLAAVIRHDVSGPVRPPAPPPPPPSRSSPLNRPPTGVYGHNPVPSSLAETYPATGNSWSREGHWHAGSDPAYSWSSRTQRRVGRLQFYLRGGVDQEQGQTQNDWSLPATSMRGMGSQPQSSDQSPNMQRLRSPTRIPPPPFLTVASGHFRVSGESLPESPQGATLPAQLAGDGSFLSTIADAGPDSNVPTEHAPLIQGLDSVGPPLDFSRPSEGRASRDLWWTTEGVTTLPPPPPPVRGPTLPPPPPPHGHPLSGQVQEVD